MKKNFLVILLLICVTTMFTLGCSSKKETETKVNKSDTYYENVDIVGNMIANGTMSVLVQIDPDVPETTTFAVDEKDMEPLVLAGQYDQEIKINIYCEKEEGKKSEKIVKYELINRQTNEKIEGFETEDDLRAILGYEQSGTYEKQLTLVKNDDFPGFGYSEEIGDFNYYTLEFQDDEGNVLEMKYIIPEGSNNSYNYDAYQEGNTYLVNYTLAPGSFGYEYTLNSIR